ncbi:MAG: M20/M25/M40 family metallo-hydrolase [Marinilabilia sp.]
MSRAFIIFIWLMFFSTITHLKSQTTETKSDALKIISGESMLADIEFLSSDLLEGREAGKRGAKMAASYIAAHFQKYGLEPFDTAASDETARKFIQSVNLVREETDQSSFSVVKKNSSYQFSENSDFAPISVEQSFTSQGNTFFGGFGLPEDLKNLDDKKDNMILVRAKGYPGANDTLSEGYAKHHHLSEDELTRKKNQAAKEAGIMAILEFDPEQPAPFTEDHAKPDAFAEEELTKYTSGIYRKRVRRADKPVSGQPPVFLISHRPLSVLFPEWQSHLSEDPESLKLNMDPGPEVKLSAKTKSIPFSCGNVVGVIPGENKDAFIVVGAHYDHLGFYDGYIWNGADDNASGVAGVMALAKAFSESGITPKHNLIFAAWTAEERGLHGSTHFVNNFDDPDRIRYYQNYDMIGRSPDPEKPDSNVSFIYTRAWEEAKELNQANNKTFDLDLKVRYADVEKPVSGSDNAPFAQKGIPIMWFHTGLNSDYHRPSDHVDKIDRAKLENIVKLSFLNLWDLSIDQN